MATVTLSPQLEETTVFQAGKEVIIPFVVSSDVPVDIDGVQVAIIFDGVAVSDVKLINYPEAHLTALTASATAQGAQAMLVTENPGQPLTVSGSVPVVGLSFVPENPGTVVLQFNLDETLVAEHESSQNVLVPPAPVEVKIVEPLTEEQKADSVKLQEQVVAQDQPIAEPGASSLFLGGLTAFIAIVVVIVGYFIFKRFRRQKNEQALVPTQSPQPVVVPPPIAAAPLLESTPTFRPPVSIELPPESPASPPQPPVTGS